MKTYPFSKVSIRRRLPLLIFGLLLIGTIIFGLISYVGVKRSALKVGQDRLLALTDQLSSLFPTSTRFYITTTRATAGQDAIKQFLRSDGKDSANEVLAALQKLRLDTAFVQVDILNADRKRLLSTAAKGIDLQMAIDSILPASSTLAPDSGQIGKLYSIGKTICYPVIVAVGDALPIGGKVKSITGYIVRWRSMQTTPQGLEQLSKLMGTGAKLYVGNSDGSLWTDMITIVPSPPINKQDKNGIINYKRTKNNPVITSIHPIAGTPWLLGVELSQEKVLEAARRFLFWIIIAGTIMLLLGIIAAWVMSNSITRPLKNLTQAASAIAAGDYSAVAQDNRYEELGKLSHAFNAMVSEVEDSQAALEKKVEEYKFLFEKNPMPMWVISRSTLDIIDVNEAAIGQYGYSRDEFLQLNAKDLRPAEDVEKYLAYARQESTKTNSGIWRHKRKNGTVIMVDITADNINYREVPAKLVLANDVTEKLKAEERQKKYTEELKSSNTELERFAYVASHDLQEPLRMISSFLNLLEEEFGEKLDNTAKEYIHYAVDGSQRMKVLVNDLLLYSRVGTNKEEFAEVDLNEVMEYVLRILNEEISKRQAVVRMQKLPVVLANKTLISQLFFNLVGNALKYHGDKRPEIDIGFTEEPGQYVFYVKDHGIGIDPKFFDKIFIIFQRLHTKADYPGTGIGLAICKKIIEVHKGEIWVESGEGKGSTFYFTILKR